MAYSPTRPDATPCAADLAARLTTAGVPVSTRDTLVAMLDSYLCAAGYQAQNSAGAALDTINATGTTFVNVWPSYTFAAPIAKTYQVNIDICASVSIVTTVFNVGFQLVVNGTPVAGPGGSSGVFLSMDTTSTYFTLRFTVPAAMIAGNNTLQLQWKALGGSGTANNAGAAYRTFTITG